MIAVYDFRFCKTTRSKSHSVCKTIDKETRKRLLAEPHTIALTTKRNKSTTFTNVKEKRGKKKRIQNDKKLETQTTTLCNTIPTQTFLEYMQSEQTRIDDLTKQRQVILDNLPNSKTRMSDEKRLHQLELQLRAPTKQQLTEIIAAYQADLKKQNNPNTLDLDYITLYKRDILCQEDNPDQVYFIEVDFCLQCKSEYFLSPEDAMSYCKKCGFATRHDESHMISTHDDGDFGGQSKRNGHMQEYLTFLQGKENTHVPEDVLHQIMSTIYIAMGIDDPNKILCHHVKTALKMLKLRKYYDHMVQVWSRITGQMPLNLTHEVVEKFKLMFAIIQLPWKLYSAKSRKKGMSYPYLVCKFAQMLNQPQILPFLSLLKDEEKLQEQEDIFEKCCHYLRLQQQAPSLTGIAHEIDWTFIPLPKDL